MLGYRYPHDAKQLRFMKSPIQGWYMTTTRGGKSGAETVDDAMPVLAPDGGQFPPVSVGLAGSAFGSESSSAIVSRNDCGGFECDYRTID